jgi:hypothetical protein
MLTVWSNHMSWFEVIKYNSRFAHFQNQALSHFEMLSRPRPFVRHSRDDELTCDDGFTSEFLPSNKICRSESSFIPSDHSHLLSYIAGSPDFFSPIFSVPPAFALDIRPAAKWKLLLRRLLIAFLIVTCIWTALSLSCARSAQSLRQKIEATRCSLSNDVTAHEQMCRAGNIREIQ